jgi:hypothetical protein
VAARLNMRAAGLHGRLQDLPQVKALLAEVLRVVGGAGEIQQVVNEPGHLPQLAVDHV